MQTLSARPQNRRKGQLKADVAHGVTVAGSHQDACRCQRGEGIRCTVDPHAQRTDPDRHRCTAHRGRKTGDPHQHKRQQAAGECTAFPAAVTYFPLIGQDRAKDVAAKYRHMHPADHQHMGKPCPAVSVPKCIRKMGPVSYRHGSQHPAGAAVHAAAKRCTKPLLQPVGARPETAALPQDRKVRGFLRLHCRQRDAIGVPVHPLIFCRGGQHKSPPHLLPGFALRHLLTLHPEIRCRAVYRLHSKHCLHRIRHPGRRHGLHLGSQHHRASGIAFLHRAPLGIGPRGGCHARHCTQQKAEGRFAGAVRDAQHKAGSNKKCRKRHKKFRLRQKSAH